MKRSAVVALVWAAPSALLVATTAIVTSAYRIAAPAPLDPAALNCLRAPDAACSVHGEGGRLVATVWLDGRTIARAEGEADELGTAIEITARGLRGRVPPGARIQLDRIGPHAPLGLPIALPWIDEIAAIAPGLEGVGAGSALVLPHELVADKLVASRQLSEQAGDFASGIDRARVRKLLAAEPSFRFRTDAVVEQRGGPPLPLVRGNTPAPPLTANALREGALAGGRYLVAHLTANGRFVYQHDLATGAQSDPVRGEYSLPRHAGTTYFLAELYRITKQEWLREPIERAIGHLAQLIAAGHCGTEAFDCLLDRNERSAQLGSTALAVVALAEYQRATGDARYLPLATRLAAFLLWMQRADGSFRHVYDPRARTADERSQQMYFSGEAALALARMHAVTGDERYAAAAERALDWLVAWYDFFVGGFFYGEEHWTCIAAEAIWPAVQKPAYRAFCDSYAEWSRSNQVTTGELAGAYDTTPFIVPYNTPAGSRTEAMVSTYLLDVHHDAPDPRIAEQIRLTLGYLLGQQVRPDNDFAAVGPVDGGIPQSAIDRTVRIDYVQHVCSAMIRASETLPW
jgi:hypothetical protein